MITKNTRNTKPHKAKWYGLDTAAARDLVQLRGENRMTVRLLPDGRILLGLSFFDVTDRIEDGRRVLAGQGCEAAISEQLYQSLRALVA